MDLRCQAGISKRVLRLRMMGQSRDEATGGKVGSAEMGA
jgi:hypothetical protein